ncbi:MAG: mycofactocin biosynthesis peptidyl-dipeptidase MftE [Actinobacteria bacterium]|nr:mycofactocin biosynthesis peptidyl-dipeptidase MftE [Actinomycetota bacterium]
MTPPIVLLALGSWEQHGAHLPFDTDTVIIESVVDAAIRSVDPENTQFSVVPTIGVTASDEHNGFAGTLSIGTNALSDAVVSIARSASWARGICIVNGHGGNADALKLVHSALNYENIRHSIWSLPYYEGADMHAGHTETSLMLHLAPDTVRMDLAEVGAIGDSEILIERMRAGGIKEVSSNGVVGDPTNATAAHGATMLSFYADHLTKLLLQIQTSWT